MNTSTRGRRQLSALKAKIRELENRILAPICICRLGTCFHNAECLSAIIKAQSVPCPAHEFRFLGAFLRVPLTERVLASDRQFCSCQVVGEAATEDRTAWPPSSELLTQIRWHRLHFEVPGRYPPKLPYAAILNEAGIGKDGRRDLNSLTDDSKRALVVAVEYHNLGIKWQKETGRTLPTCLSIMELKLAKSRAQM